LPSDQREPGHHHVEGAEGVKILREIRTDELKAGDVIVYDEGLYIVGKKPYHTVEGNPYMTVELKEHADDKEPWKITAQDWLAGWVVARPDN
jgi:intein/homing endonuclease